MKAISRFILPSIVYFTFAASLLAQQSTFSKVFEDNFSSAQCYSIVNSFDLNYMIVGSRDNDGLLLKMNVEGNIIWDKRFKFGNNQAIFSQIIPTFDSSFVIIGSVNGNFIVMKTTANGDTLWTKSIDLGFYDYAVSIQQTFDNGFILGGYSNQYTPSYLEIMSLVKLDSNGEVEWARQFSNGSNRCLAYSVKQMPDSGYIIAGEASNSPTYYNASLTRLNSNGSILWSKYLESYLQGSERINDVIVSDSAVVCYAQVTNNRSCVLKSDFNGNVAWAKQMDMYSEGVDILGHPMPSIHPTADGGFAFVSTTNSFISGSLIKTDSTGSLDWAQYQELLTTDVIESDDNGFISIGNGPLVGVKLSENFNPQIGIIKSDSLGNSSGCANLWGTMFDTISINFVESSLTASEAEFSASSLHPVITSSGLSSRYGCVAFIGSVDEEKAPAFTVFPNPSNGTFQIQINQQENFSFQKLTIYNLEGKAVFESENPELLQSEIKLPSLPNGLYFAQLAFKESNYTVKFLYQK